jgi:natural product biosynthesis luciferase-like monooxygenase protein
MIEDSLFSNLVEGLQYRAMYSGDKVAYTFLIDGEEESGSLTFRELDFRARLIAANLQRHARPGERALLVYASGLEYVAAFFGCLYAGVIAVPVYPPRANGNLSRLLSVGNDCQATLMLSVRDFSQQLRDARVPWDLQKPFRLIETDDLAEDSLTGWQKPEIDSDTIAFFQYTSGSTADPKGVMVSHGNLMHNLKALKETYGFTDQIRFVSWLPIYHDMGLIGVILSTMYNGGRCIFMSPAAFIQQPVRWLEAFSRYKGTCAMAPNFAFDLCARKVSAEQLEKLDLSAWEVAINGAEPVRADSVRRFIETFEPCGVRKNTLRPSYGLAEGTLFVSGCRADSRDSIRAFDTASLTLDFAVEVPESWGNSRLLVGCGLGVSDQRIAIVNIDTLAECPSGRIGEIWLRSASVARGYWNKPEVTKSTFQAYIADTGAGPFLRTGDLGFLYQGNLYITGRHKDLIIVNGRNFYPQDIEFTAEQSHPALRPGCGAAFSVSDQEGERIVVVYEIARTQARGLDVDEVADCVRRTIAEEHELEIHTVVFLKSGGIPKTSSGKIQRRLCRTRFLAGDLEQIQKDDAPPMAAASGARAPGLVPQPNPQPMQFSLFYFSSNEAEFQGNKYRLLLEGAKFADEHDFTAVWVPERHFHAFGGLYPNPSVLASALAVTTKRVRIRAGSVVLPLHDPIRVAEEWAVVDNLSDGRVDLAFARGWNPNDFVLAPLNFSESLKVLYQKMEIVGKLWSGAFIPVPNGKGEETQIRIYPQPSQSALNVWLTCSGGVERFVEAGTAGVNTLTALLFQSVDELGRKIAAYQEARRRAGHVSAGHVTLMMHTFLGTDEEEVKQKVRGPFIEYLKSSIDLWQSGWEDLRNMAPERANEVLGLAFERYYQTSGLFGTPETCLETIQKLKQAGVDEIACLIDFGVEEADALKGLHALHWLQEKTRGLHAQASRPAPVVESGLHGVAPGRTTGEILSHNQTLPGLVQQTITGIISGVTKLRPEVITPGNHFLTLGINSLKGAEILNVMQQQFDLKLAHSLLFEFPTVERLSEMLVREHKDHLSRQFSWRAGQETVAATEVRPPEKSFAAKGSPSA